MGFFLLFNVIHKWFHSESESLQFYYLFTLCFWGVPMLRVKVIHPNFQILLFNWMHESTTIKLFLFHHLANMLQWTSLNFSLCTCVWELFKRRHLALVGCWAMLIYHSINTAKSSISPYPPTLLWMVFCYLS